MDSPRSLSSFDYSQPASSQRLDRLPYIGPVLPQQPNLLATPVSQPSPLHLLLLEEETLNPHWFDVGSTPDPTLVPLLLRVDPAQDFSHPAGPIGPTRPAVPSTPLPNPQAADMIDVTTFQFDPLFNMGSRSTFNWPIFESGNGGLLGYDLSSYGSDASLTLGSRSGTANPPRPNLTPEQRELKRQRDQARRENKNAVRVRRVASGSYVHSPPVSMADLAGSSSLPVYTTGPTPISLLIETTTMAPAPSYMPAYSPPLPADQPQNIFPAQYQQQYMPEYQSAYPTMTAPSLPSHYGPDTSSLPQQQQQHQGSPPYGQPMMLTRTQPHNRPTMGHDPGAIMYSCIPDTGPWSAWLHEGGNVRVVQSRPKPQCWEHGCNGRQFSNFGNLLRHQREKSGQASKAVCPNCKVKFSRNNARDIHVLGQKCKPKQSDSPCFT